MEKTRYYYDRPNVAIDKLKAEGYTTDYNEHFDYIEANAADYYIDVVYRYEGESDPGDEASVYGLHNEVTGEKGMFVTGNLSFIEGRKQEIILALELKSRNL